MSIDTFPGHAPSPFYDVDAADQLLIGGRTAASLVAQAGRTPVYVYDTAVMRRQVEALRAAFPREIELHYAIKANPLPAVVDFMSKLVDGLDVASGRELRTAMRTSVPRHDISFAGPGKSVAELREAIEAEIVINVESPRELREIVAIARETGRRPAVAIRVNPDFELKSSGMKMGGGPKQFGVDAEAVPAMLRSLADLPVEFVGFHIFSGSQNLRAEAIVEAQQKAYALALRLAADAPAPLRILNLGGGIGIPYFPGEQRVPLASIGENLAAIAARARTEMPGTKLVVELGRYFVGEAGIYLCRVVDRKISRGQVFLVTDGGLHHHLSASGNFGQVIRKNYPVLIANRVRGSERENSSVVGPLCTPLDLLADRMEMARADEGDLVAVFMSGAYGYTASPLGFLSHPEPLEIVV
jgi:diaminopimelate decarboxylase